MLALPTLDGHSIGVIRTGRVARLSLALADDNGGSDADGKQLTTIAARHNTAVAYTDLRIPTPSMLSYFKT
ncbi:hypothetical protein [Mycobacterium lepromatosis]|uniref:hypothetical protein n=1 Tax=Mycobacterium lepromatosis TaxID=480418 RepID=UPI0005F76F36|nr:hypothetical protein [Mycobacterium lepromatosis]